MSSSGDIVVRSHVGRDLQQSGQLFNTDRKVVWEYVVNSLQYVDPDTAPAVEVVLDNRTHAIVVVDNGRGMDWSGLQNYFVMHAENEDRLAGRAGRGRFGTGKSAAFGIADTLVVRSVKDGKRSTVQLTREDIESDAAEHGIPTTTLEREVPTSEPNGTRVEIARVKLHKLDANSVIEHIERNLAYYRRDARITVNGRPCEYVEPPVEQEWRFKPEGRLAGSLGDIELIIKKAYSPLDEAQRGVAILANGVVHELTLGTSEGKEMSQYLFGEVDVPALDEDQSVPAPFTMDRSGALNRSNTLVLDIFAFIDPCIAQVRQQLATDARERRESEEARRLQEEADRIAEVINEDFRDFKDRLRRARAKGRGAADAFEGRAPNGVDGDVVFGDEVPATLTPLDTPSGSDTHSGTGAEQTPNVTPLPDSKELLGAPAGGNGKSRKSGGGFHVEFEHQGEEGRRTKYMPESRTIYVNLDHPQIANAIRQGDTDSPAFKRLAYEVAFTEYAVAIAQELSDANFYLEVQDALYDIRDLLDRMARKTAPLFDGDA